MVLVVLAKGTGLIGTKVLKKTISKKPAIQKKVAAPQKSGTQKSAGFRKYDGAALWLPNTARPEWLDGSLPGDRGFDPLGLSKPATYLQYDFDSQNQNLSKNQKGRLIGEFAPSIDEVSTDTLAPYSEVFGLQRFRECELIHGRWAMLACLGVLVAEGLTGVAWQDAGKVELDGAQYLGFSLPFTIPQLIIIEVLLVGGAELYRNSQLDPEKRCYPGGAFDPLKLTEGEPDRVFKLKEAEMKHARLAMVAFFGYSVQALATGDGALASLARFSKSF